MADTSAMSAAKLAADIQKQMGIVLEHPNNEAALEGLQRDAAFIDCHGTSYLLDIGRFPDADPFRGNVREELKNIEANDHVPNVVITSSGQIVSTIDLPGTQGTRTVVASPDGSTQIIDGTPGADLQFPG